MNDKMSHDKILYERLREKRNEIAQKEGVKPYMVFQNEVLAQISEKKPATREELAQVKGMGPKKMARYGQLVLQMVNHQDDEKEEKETAREKIYSVAEFLEAVNELLVPKRAIVQGEISQVKVMDNYAFFTLADKNKEAVLNCFVWQNKLESFGMELREGLELKVEGFGRVFKRNGRFSFEVERLGLVGEGALKQAFENLK
ncbi:MAG TPA: exodeoxyribonuclease VII large subunit, partial [Candidatus Woesebacteria bacterium]|nr:exodeoxyribonuclease VII large subunit [Candidatus Woesebacteria bacterium]